MSDPESFGPHVGGNDGEWARLGRLIGSDPDAVWARLLEVAATTDDAGLYWVGDIIEDLVTLHGWAFAPKLEAELAGNQRLRRAFVHVVPGHADEELEDRLLELREQIEAADG